MQFSHKQKSFSNFFGKFLNLDQILNILEKKMILIGYVFPILWTAKDVAT